jgi:hypothetical protein
VTGIGKLTRALAITATAVGFVAQGTPVAAGTGVTKQYVVAQDAATVNPRAVTDGCGPGASPAIGGDCFDVQGGTISIAVRDASGGDVNVSYSFKDAGGTTIPGGGFCTKKDVVAVPDAANLMFVTVGVTGAKAGTGGVSNNPPCGGPKPASTGTITIDGGGVPSAPVALSPALRPGSAHLAVAPPVTARAAAPVRASRNFRLL